MTHTGLLVSSDYIQATNSPCNIELGLIIFIRVLIWLSKLSVVQIKNNLEDYTA
jgi:hypothetical protein